MQTLSYVSAVKAPSNTSQTVPTFLPEQLHHHLLTEKFFDITIAKDPFMVVSMLIWQYKL